MPQAEDVELVTSSSLELARARLKSGDCDGAAGIVRTIMALLYEKRTSSRQDAGLSECFETLGDVHSADKRFEAALTAYEQALKLRTKTGNETGAEAMNVLFKMEQTLSDLVSAGKISRTTEQMELRWRADVLKGESDAAEKRIWQEKESDFKAERVNTLWEEAVLRSKTLEEAGEVPREVRAAKKTNADPYGKTFDGWLSIAAHMLFQFMPVIFLCLMIGILYKTFGSFKQGVDVVVQSPDFRFIMMQKPHASTKGIAAKSTIAGIVAGTNKLYVSGDASQQLKFNEEQAGEWSKSGASYTLPYVVDDGSAWSRLNLCMQTLRSRRILWLVPTLYGLEDESGNTYLEVGSSEYKLVQHMRQIAKQLGDVPKQPTDEQLKDVKSKLGAADFDDPFNGTHSSVITAQVQAPSVSDAIRQLGPRLTGHGPGTIVCLLVDTGHGTQTAICGLDRAAKLIPFANRQTPFLLLGAPSPTVASLEPEKATGIVVLPVASSLAHHAGLIMAITMAFIFMFAGMLFHMRSVRMVFFGLSFGLIIAAVIGAMGT